MTPEHHIRDLKIGFARWRDPSKRNVGFSPFPFFLRKNGNFPLHFHSYSKVAPLQHSIKYKGKLTRMLMHLNDSQIIANIYFTTKEKSCESVYERKTTDGVTTTKTLTPKHDLISWPGRTCRRKDGWHPRIIRCFCAVPLKST